MYYIIGTGYMAREYAKVLKGMNQPFIAIGRGSASAIKFSEDFNVNVSTGGLSVFLENKPKLPDAAIVCTPVETLSSVTMELLEYGVKKILLEKPGGLSSSELLDLKNKSTKLNANVLIGYNRRFYCSTLALIEKLKSETLIAANFEITEWSNVITNEKCSSNVKDRWVYANTSHVIDLILKITGPIEKISTYNAGKLDWHESASRFAGAGISDSGVLISYMGYWDGPGRWSAEFVTKTNRYIFRPMEKLQVQKINTVSVADVKNIDYSLDEKYKPGLYLQTQAFINDEYENLCSLEEQLINFKLYSRIAGYQN